MTGGDSVTFRSLLQSRERKKKLTFVQKPEQRIERVKSWRLCQEERDAYLHFLADVSHVM